MKTLIINTRGSFTDEITNVGIVITCNENMDYIISEADYNRIKNEFPAAFDDIYIVEEEKDINYVSFHIGRGGSHHNPGHITFMGEENFQQLIKRCSDVCTIWDTDENDKPIADSDWKLLDRGGNIILQGRNEIEAMTGMLEWDGDYNTDYSKRVADLYKEEIEAVWEAYINEEYMSETLKNDICSLKGYKRLSSIKRYPSNIEVSSQEGVESISIDGLVGKMTRDDWTEYLEEHSYCPKSIEKILDYMEHNCDTNTEEFFEEDND